MPNGCRVFLAAEPPPRRFPTTAQATQDARHVAFRLFREEERNAVAAEQVLNNVAARTRRDANEPEADRLNRFEAVRSRQREVCAERSESNSRSGPSAIVPRSDGHSARTGRNGLSNDDASSRRGSTFAHWDNGDTMNLGLAEVELRRPVDDTARYYLRGFGPLGRPRYNDLDYSVYRYCPDAFGRHLMRLPERIKLFDCDCGCEFGSECVYTIRRSISVDNFSNISSAYGGNVSSSDDDAYSNISSAYGGNVSSSDDDAIPSTSRGYRGNANTSNDNAIPSTSSGYRGNASTSNDNAIPSTSSGYRGNASTSNDGAIPGTSSDYRGNASTSNDGAIPGTSSGYRGQNYISDSD